MKEKNTSVEQKTTGYRSSCPLVRLNHIKCAVRQLNLTSTQHSAIIIPDNLYPAVLHAKDVPAFDVFCDLSALIAAAVVPSRILLLCWPWCCGCSVNYFMTAECQGLNDNTIVVPEIVEYFWWYVFALPSKCTGRTLANEVHDGICALLTRQVLRPAKVMLGGGDQAFRKVVWFMHGLIALSSFIIIIVIIIIMTIIIIIVIIIIMTIIIITVI